MSNVTVVCTSFNRIDLLIRTIDSFIRFNTYPIEEFILIEDSGNKKMHDLVKMIVETRQMNFNLILNDKNIGAYESIDLAYSKVKTDFVFHLEDDFEFYKSGFIEPALEVLEDSKIIMQVNFSNEFGQPIEPGIYKTINNPTDFRIVGTDVNGWWHGFTCNPNLRSMAAYNKVKPYTQWSTKKDCLSLQECKIGMRYFELGYKVAVLNDYYCKHIGINRCTWHQ